MHICCSGAASAQGLADYLLHSVISDDQALDVPLLLAPSPFVHASLQQAQPQVRHQCCALSVQRLLRRCHY